MADPALYGDAAGGLPPDAADLASLQYPWSVPPALALQPGLGIPAAALGPPTQDELAAHAMAALAQPAPPEQQAAPPPESPPYAGPPLSVAGPAGPPAFGPPAPTVAQLPDFTVSTERQPSEAEALAGDPLRTQPGAQGPIGQLAPTQILSDEEAGRAIANLPPEKQAEVRAKLDAAKAEDFATKLVEASTANRVRAQEDADRYQKATEAAAQKAAELEHDYKALAATTIDTSGRMGTGQRIAGILAATIGGLVSGRTGGPNQGMLMLQHTIDQDVEAQKADLANRRGILGARQGAVSEMFARSGDMYRAQETARAAAWETTIQQLQAEQMKFDPRGTTSMRIADTITQARGLQQAGLRAYGQQQFKNYLDLSKESREGQLAQSTIGKNASEVTKNNAESAKLYSKLGGGGGGGPGAAGTGYQVATGFYNPFMHPDEPGAAVMGKRQIGGKGEDAKERKGVQDQLDVYAGVNDYYGKLADIGRRIGNAKSLGESIWSARKGTLGAEYDNAREALMVYLTKQLGDKLTQGQLEAQQHRIPERASVFETRDPGKQIQDALIDADRDFGRSMSVVGIDADPVVKIAQRQRAVVQASSTQELDAAQAAAAAHPENKDAQSALAAASQRVHDETAATQKRQQDVATVRDLPPPPAPLPELDGRPVAEAAAVKEANRANLRFTQLLQRFHTAAGDTSYRKGLKPGEVAAADAADTTKLGSLAGEVLDAQVLAEQQRTKAAGEIRRHEIADRAKAAGIDPDEALRRARLGLPIGDEQPTAPLVQQPEPNPLAPNASYLPGADPFGPPVNSSQAVFPPPRAKPKKKGR
jgi:hypothetical protein